MAIVGKTAHIAGKRAGRIKKSFKFNARNHVRMFTEAVLGKGFLGNATEAGRHDHCSDIKSPFLRFLAEINGFALADRDADLAGLIVEMETAARIDIIGRRDSLWIINMDGTGNIQPLVVIIYLMAWTICCAEAAGGTIIRIDISGTQTDISFKITWFALDGKQISICKNFDIWRPTGLNQLGRQDSERTVVGREGLIQLSHYPADGR